MCRSNSGPSHHMHVCMSMHVCVHVTYVCMCMCVCVHVCMCASMCTCMCPCAFGNSMLMHAQLLHVQLPMCIWAFYVDACAVGQPTIYMCASPNLLWDGEGLGMCVCVWRYIFFMTMIILNVSIHIWLNIPFPVQIHATPKCVHGRH